MTNGEQIKVLIVDDTPENIDVLGQILKSHYKRAVALNGPKALEIAASDNPPDIILLGHHDAGYGRVRSLSPPQGLRIHQGQYRSSS